MVERAAVIKGKVLIATVKGDIHDIGKNIVALLLRNSGYDVIDLGKDISTREIIAAAKRENPDVIGLSALMTTTMVNMKEVIATAAQEGLKANFLLGGAVVAAVRPDDRARRLAGLALEEGRQLENVDAGHPAVEQLEHGEAAAPVVHGDDDRVHLVLARPSQQVAGPRRWACCPTTPNHATRTTSRRRGGSRARALGT